MKLSIPLIIFLSLLLQGCLGNKNAINDDQLFLQSTPSCNTEKMCATMWKAAGDWVSRYSPQGIETFTDELIRSEEKELGSEEMDIEIRKIKAKDGSFQIVINNHCNRSLSSCRAERDNMIAFNKKLIGYMSNEDRASKKQVLEDDQDIKQWLESYAQFSTRSDAKSLSAMMHYPVTFIEGDSEQVVSSENQLVSYLQSVKDKIAEVNGVYLKPGSIDVFGRTGRNLYVNAVISLYDVENQMVAAQQIGFHLLKVDTNWQMISSALHTK